MVPEAHPYKVPVLEQPVPASPMPRQVVTTPGLPPGLFRIGGPTAQGMERMGRGITLAVQTLVATSVLAGPAALAGGGPPASRLLRDIEQLQVVGSVLYVAAHPDDENTRLLSWLTGERGLDATYLSMTRGGGGQNLIGAEQAELLGVIRTGELLAARSLDGARQRFTRMRDFGYSRSSEETLALWDRDQALADVVQAFDELRPDVVITRFPTEGQTHGHHLASAILARDAFDAATWRPARLLRNVSHWSLTPDTDTSAWWEIDVGGFDPLSGASWGEVAARSRTMHKSQGFGAAPQVGPQREYLEHLAGSRPSGPDPFADLDLTWSRFPGTQKLVKTLDQAARQFDPRAPQAVLPTLARAHALMSQVPDDHWRARKLADLEQVMADCAGLWVTARADRPAVAPGEPLTITLTALARNAAPVTVHAVRLITSDARDLGQVSGVPLAHHQPWSAELTVPAPDTLTVPHWLAEPPSPFRYEIGDPAWRTQPDTPAVLQAAFDVTLAGQRLTLQRPVTFAWTDAVDGERVQPAEVLPPVTATFAQQALVFPADGSGVARLTLQATTATSGTLSLDPGGFSVEPATIPFQLAEGEEKVVELAVSVQDGATPHVLTVTVDGAPAYGRAVIDYPHLPRRTILQPASLQVVPVELERGPVQRIGYVMGSGDKVPDALRAVGYTVDELDEVALLGDLSSYDAVVLGVRAFNTRPRLLSLHDALMAYVAGGGRLIVQYNTNNRFNPLDAPIGPAPLEIGRDRVTDETAPLTPTDPQHPALTTPNALTEADFQGWVQERGLYFARSWDPIYQPVFSTQDPGHEPLLGSTLVARHGEGVFVYTGLSFFRQLPAGVPGAYRLFANLLAQ